MEFMGKIYSRTNGSTNAQVPSESVILGLNPNRANRIQAATRWSRVEPGSLNLRVEPSTVDALLQCHETILEPANEITYPPGFCHIPQARQAYLYYLATAMAAGRDDAVDVLVRRAKVPPFKGVLELFSYVSLRQRLKLHDDDMVKVMLKCVGRVGFINPTPRRG